MKCGYGTTTRGNGVVIAVLILSSKRRGGIVKPTLVSTPIPANSHARPATSAIECRLASIVEQGDHHIVVGEVLDAHLNKPLAGRPDILEMKDLGDNVFYGGSVSLPTGKPRRFPRSTQYLLRRTMNFSDE